MLSHKEEYNQVYVQLTRLPPADAERITAHLSYGIRAVTAEDIAKVQKVSDLFSALKILPNKVDVAAITVHGRFAHALMYSLLIVK
ncbi:hypothetical protein [Candidatus Pantoea persica]|uniref:hypothetical protein n=1 Tax=Candidatus Pantoea persica TaxID=2518128 RepID=UPI00215DA173|nr:hypothetical protein [Candidatus Pantoea persica]MBA2817408.1 nitrate ABC transporter substrate-binding protein [Candidatus Pantoea persica]